MRMEDVPDPQVAERAKRRSYSAKYKAEILAEYDAADRDGRGALVGRESLYSSLISEWRKQAGKGALEALGKTRGRPTADPVERENARLRAEVAKLRPRRRRLGGRSRCRESSPRCWQSCRRHRLCRLFCLVGEKATGLFSKDRGVLVALSNGQVHITQG